MEKLRYSRRVLRVCSILLQTTKLRWTISTSSIFLTTSVKERMDSKVSWKHFAELEEACGRVGFSVSLSEMKVVFFVPGRCFLLIPAIYHLVNRCGVVSMVPRYWRCTIPLGRDFAFCDCNAMVGICLRKSAALNLMFSGLDALYKGMIFNFWKVIVHRF